MSIKRIKATNDLFSAKGFQIARAGQTVDVLTAIADQYIADGNATEVVVLPEVDLKKQPPAAFRKKIEEEEKKK